MFPLLLSPAILTLFQMFSFLHARQIELNEKIKLSWRRYVHLRCITSWWSKFWICIRFFTRTAVLPLSLCVRMRTALHIKFFFCFQFSSSYIPFAPFLVLLTFWESPFYCSISALLFFFWCAVPQFLESQDLQLCTVLSIQVKYSGTETLQGIDAEGWLRPKSQSQSDKEPQTSRLPSGFSEACS